MPLWASGHSLLNCSLDWWAKESPVSSVDAAIHKPITVGWRHDAILGHREQVTLLHGYLWERAKGFSPCPNEATVVIDEVQSHGIITGSEFSSEQSS